MFDPLGLTTRMMLLLSPPFFVLAYILFSGASADQGAVIGAVGVSFLFSVAFAGWMVRSVVAERRAAKRVQTELTSAQGALEVSELKADRDRQLQMGFEEMEGALLGGLSVASLARGVITGLCGFVEAPVGAIYLRDDADDAPIYRRVAGFALGDDQLGKSFGLGVGLVGQVAATGEAMEISAPDETPVVLDDGLHRRGSPAALALWPLGNKDEVIGVIVLGLQGPLRGGKRRFAKRIMRSVAMSFETAIARRTAEAALTSYKDLAEQLGEQTKALEAAHREVEARNIDLQKAESEAAQRAAEAAQANRYKSEFLANMSHELRTPLNSIILLSKMLADGRSGELSSAQEKQASVIHHAGEDLLNLINDVLDLSKIEAGRMSIVVEEVEVAGLLKSVEALFAPLAQGKGVAISCSVHPAVPKTIFSAGDRVKQILRNFVSNAVKFVETGSIELLAEPPDEKYWQALRGDEALAAEAERRPQEFIVFAVRDTGIGIPEERQQAIFEAFRQADGTTSRRYGGTGLGLSIVSNFAALLGGGVGLWSTVAEGSTFFALLPIVSEEHTSALIAAPTAQQLRQIEPVDGTFAEETVVAITEITTNSEETEARPAGWGDGRRLLVVDDDVRNTYALTIALEAEGFVVVAAGNGRDALDTLDKDTSFSAVLMDIMMPEMDGYEAMRILRADSRFAALPVLALTARTQEEDRAACFEAGATDFIAKPIDHDQLLSCLSAALTRLETL